MYPGANIFQQVAFRHHPGKEDFKWSVQSFRARIKLVDWAEASRFLIYGGLCHSVLVHNWMHLVQKLFPGTSTRQILKKVHLFPFCKLF